MRFCLPNRLLAGTFALASVVFLATAGVGKNPAKPEGLPEKITIDYPQNGSVFPPEITSPTILWHDPSTTARRWLIDISFADHSPALRVDAPGDLLKLGEIDPQAASGDAIAQLTPEQAATRTWKPDAATWKKIKNGSVNAPATITITGLADDSNSPLSPGTTTISTSRDPVGAPVFYRDVPLMLPPPGDKGSIQPLPPSAIPLIKWRLRNIGEPESRTVMQNLPTCANCHSFSADGATLGIDVDGPKNDKGLYALASVTRNMTIRNQDVLRWSSFQEDVGAQSSDIAVKRFGFMSQVSPDGRYVVTSIGPPAASNVHQRENPAFAPGLSDRLFSTNYSDIHFIQVFYPTRGILAWYDRKQEKMKPLPGADNPQFVQTSAFWSPDGKYLIFSRAKAIDPYPPGAKKPEYANDPNEPQIQYDLYRIPFNHGRGGIALPLVGASRNGMSNNFPKVSPDGRWIVFVQNRNGLLMRPDSKLYIIPSAGGKARVMNCNGPLMNSWHTFSPNGRWLAFSTKSRSPYTQLMLTHIDSQGNDSPAILVENTTAANRAVNIPEFVNLPADGLVSIDPQATEFYRLFNQAWQLIENNQMAAAIPVLRNAEQQDSDDALVHYALATALTATDREREALEEYRKACVLHPRNPAWLAQFAVSLALNGDLDQAELNWRRSLRLDPSNVGVATDLGMALAENGHIPEGYEYLRKAVDMAPTFPQAHNDLGLTLARMGRLDDAIDQLQEAVALLPKSVEYRFSLGYLMELRGDSSGSIAAFQKAVALSEGKDWRSLSALAEAYNRAGRFIEATQAAQQALDLVLQQHDVQLEKTTREALERYEGASRTGQSSSPH